MNPVTIAFNQEVAHFMTAAKHGVSHKKAKSHASTLLSLWNNYANRLNHELFVQNILALGSFLYSQQKYTLAVNFCYGPYLQKRFNVTFDTLFTSESKMFMESFFPAGTKHSELPYLLEAFIGFASCFAFKCMAEDEHFLKKQTKDQILVSIQILQHCTRIAQLKDGYGGLLHNCIVHIFTICRYLMVNKNPLLSLDHLLWACVCTEKITTVKNLYWLGQLYVCTTKCYYEIKADIHAEEFARRALKKINGFRYPFCSSSPFKQAIIQLNVLIFKRHSLEKRKQPISLMRTKVKPFLKDMVNAAWPRTMLEKLLSDTFNCRASRYLAVIEAFDLSNRRIIYTSPSPMLETDEHLSDLYVELFFAAVELLAGGGGTVTTLSMEKRQGLINDVCPEKSLLELAVIDSSNISLTSVTRFLFIAYHYENWDVFESLAPIAVNTLEKHSHEKKFANQRQILEILYAMYFVNPSKIKKKLVCMKKGSATARSHKSVYIDDLLTVAQLLKKYLLDAKNSQDIFICDYHDILLDTVLFLWAKCKTRFARITSSSIQLTAKQTIYDDQSFCAWFEILYITKQCMESVHVTDIDISIIGEAALKISLIVEAFVMHKNEKVTDMETTDECKEITTFSETRNKIAAVLNVQSTQVPLLTVARTILKSALVKIDAARDGLLSSVKTQLPDNVYEMNFIALHLEVLYHHSYVSMLVHQLSMLHRVQTNKSKDSHLPDEVGQNELMHVIQLLACEEAKEEANCASNSAKNLEEILDLLKKVMQAEGKYLKANKIAFQISATALPPPPIILGEGSQCVLLKPAVFQSNDRERVRYYAVFVRSAAGNNVKVRLNDNNFKGTGEQLSSGDRCIFLVSGLHPNTRYVAAVAAYDENGNLIEDSIGHTGSSFLTAHFLPTLHVFAYLIKVAYKRKQWGICNAAFNVLWSHFIDEPCVENFTSNVESYQLSVKSLNLVAVSKASSVLQRLFVQSVFIAVDVAIKECGLHYNNVCDQGLPSDGQIARLSQCEKLLVVIEMSGYLNDELLCLQSCVQLCALISPFAYWKLETPSISKLLMFLFGALNEVCNALKSKKKNHITDMLQHMVICFSYYQSQLLSSSGRFHSSLRTIESGGKMAALIVPAVGENNPDAVPTDKSIMLKKHPTRRTRIKGVVKTYSALKPSTDQSSIARAFELYTYKLQRLNNTSEMELELNGTEDSITLTAVVDMLPPTLAFKEVTKFKKRSFYLSNLYRVAAKAFNERMFEAVIDWSSEAINWLNKRNDVILSKLNATDTKAAFDDHKLHGAVEYKNLGSHKMIEIKKISIMTSEEKRIRDAVNKVQKLLPDVWKAIKRRKKLRVFSQNELPFRSQLNLFAADSCFKLAMDVFDSMSQKLTEKNLQFTSNAIDTAMYKLEVVGCLLVSSPGSMKTDNTMMMQKNQSLSFSTVKGGIETTDSSSKVSSNESTTVSTERKQSLNPAEDKTSLIHHFQQSCLFYQRALVLARRGKKWGLLQHICLNMNYNLQQFVVQVNSIQMNLGRASQEELVFLNEFRTLLSVPFQLAADFTLDLMCHADYESDSKDPNGVSTSTVEFSQLKSVIFYAIEVLIYERKFESVCALIIRFNSLTCSEYLEVLSPILVYAQKHLEAIAKVHPDYLYNVKSGLITRIQGTTIRLESDIKPTAIPIDCHKTLLNLQKYAKLKPHGSRCLGHCRKLLSAYLIGKANPSKVQQVKNSGSHVTFLVSDLKLPSCGPTDYTEERFEQLEDLEFYLLPLDSHLTAIIMAYEQAVSALMEEQDKQLASQAMHELGNIVFCVNDKKNALKWWSMSLDCSFKQHNSLETWLKYRTTDDGISACKKLIQRIGVWGCMQVGVVATKIARYILEKDVSQCMKACHLACACFQALFTASIDHPTAFHSYAEYEIGAHHKVKRIIPGINIFSDVHRVHCGSLTAQILWLAQQLVTTGHFLEVQPILTLAQYLADDICQELLVSVQVKLLRVQSLSRLQMFEVAVKHFADLLLGLNLPHPADSIRGKLSHRSWPQLSHSTFSFPCGTFIAELCNYNLTPVHLSIYGRSLCQEIRFHQSVMLLCMSDVLNEVPNFDTCDRNEEKTKFAYSLPPHSTEHQLLADELKGKLVNAAKRLLKKLLKKDTDNEGATQRLFVKCHCQLALLKEQCLMMSLSTNHIEMCLQTMSKCENDTLLLPSCDNHTTPVYTWLSCKRQLCKFLYESMSCSLQRFNGNIAQAFTEFEIFNCKAFDLQLLMIRSKLQNKSPMESALIELKALDEEINKTAFKSLHDKILSFDVQILITDLTAVHHGNVEETYDCYQSTEENILREMRQHGYGIDQESKFPLQPLTNVNSVLLKYLFAIKLRCFRYQALLAAKDDSTGVRRQVLSDIEVCLSVMESATHKDIAVELNLKLLKGKIERQLSKDDASLALSSVMTFSGVVELSKNFTRDLSLLRQCFTEKSLAWLSISTLHSEDRQVNQENAWYNIRVASVLDTAQRKFKTLTNNSELCAEAACNVHSFCRQDVEAQPSSDDKSEINWLHMLNYLARLKQRCSYTAVVQDRPHVVEVPLHCNSSQLKLKLTNDYLYKELDMRKYCPEMLVDLLQEKDLPASQSDCYPDQQNLPSDIARNPLYAGDHEIAMLWYANDWDNTSLRFVAALNKEANMSSVVLKQGSVGDGIVELHERLVEVLLQWQANETLKNTSITASVLTNSCSRKKKQSSEVEMGQISPVTSLLKEIQALFGATKNEFVDPQVADMKKLVKLINPNRAHFTRVSPQLFQWLSAVLPSK